MVNNPPTQIITIEKSVCMDYARETITKLEHDKKV